MKLRFGSLALGGVAALTAALLASNDARACGGCFHPENQPETTLVTGHRMALSISQAQTVLWDQVQYSGSPSEFAWVLPVKPGAHVELANNAWFEALDAATSTRVVPPQLNCVQQAFTEGGSSPGCGCGAASFADSASGGSGDPNAVAPPAVTVVHQGSVGPYDTVTLHANVPGSLTSWLTTHSFAIDASIKPIIDAYTADGFDFIALRLKPDVGIQQMQPVRVVSPGAVPVLPLRMVAAGTGANVDITLFVIGEGRWSTKNFPGATVDAAKLSWDFNTSASNYSTLRADLLATGSGRTWLDAYAKHGSLLSTLGNPVNVGANLQYTTAADSAGNTFVASTIAELYVRQGLSEGVAASGDCLGAFPQYQQSHDLVVDVCPDAGNGTGGSGGTGAGGSGGAGGASSTGAGGNGAGGAAACGTTKQGEIDARTFACGSLDDLAVALTGTHPNDVWLTRLESNLPHAALVDDLQIEASAAQTEVENWLTAVTPVNPPCTLAAPPIVTPKTGGGSTPRRRGGFGDLAALATGLAALGAMMGRRTTRRARTA
jgi:hypothetical protein